MWPFTDKPESSLEVLNLELERLHKELKRAGKESDKARYFAILERVVSLQNVLIKTLHAEIDVLEVEEFGARLKA